MLIVVAPVAEWEVIVDADKVDIPMRPKRIKVEVEVSVSLVVRIF